MSDEFAGLSLPVDTPARMQIVHPVTKLPMVDPDGNPAYLDLLSTDSAAAVAFDQKIIEERAARPHHAKLTPADSIEIGCRRLAALTRGWHLVDVRDGSVMDIEFSVEKAVKLYNAGGERNWLREQAMIFLADRANFPLRSSKD